MRGNERQISLLLIVLLLIGGWASLYQFKMLSLDDATAYSQTNKKDYRSALAVVFIAVFLISVKLVLKYESE